MYTIRLENTVTHQIYEQQVEDHNNGEKMYFRFGVSTFDLGDGEYILTLLNAEGDVLAEDLMRIGDYNPEAIQYSKGENTYIDVTLNAVLQEDKYVTINEIETRIVPDLGNDAIETVYVNAQPLYDSARSEGYDEGYSVGQSEGYPNGFADGYDSGRTDGINEQKDKLTQITISENGVYANENGYNEVVVEVPDLNGDYNEGYEQGHTDGYNEGYSVGSEEGVEGYAKNIARVLDVTENGTYRSEYSDPYYISDPTGDNFYDSAIVKDRVYDTQIPLSQDVTFEIWFKPEGIIDDDGYGAILGASKQDYYYNDLWLRHRNGGDIDDYEFRYGFYNCIFKLKLESLNHIALRKHPAGDDGFVFLVNEQVVGAFNTSSLGQITSNTNIYINGSEVTKDGRTDDGVYGMIKINDVVIIPTENGFKRLDNGEILPSIYDGGSYTYQQGEIVYPSGPLYKTVNVNVLPTINVGLLKIRLAHSVFEEVPDVFVFGDWSVYEDKNWKSLAYMFYSCAYLKKAPEIDTSDCYYMNHMFYGCSSLSEVPFYDTHNIGSFESMFEGCSSLATVPHFDTSEATSLYKMFSSCTNLTTVPAFDTSNVTDMRYMFYDFGGMKLLTSLPKFNCQKVTDMTRYFSYYNDGMSSLTDVGGWENLSCDWNDNYGLRACPNLTYQSCINILNGLYDFVGNGSATRKTLKVNSNFLTTVGDDIAIGTSKGWTITA